MKTPPAVLTSGADIEMTDGENNGNRDMSSTIMQSQEPNTIVSPFETSQDVIFEADEASAVEASDAMALAHVSSTLDC